jgi:ferredoxin/coenzyme F420-reducing hydrogenase delta subunit
MPEIAVVEEPTSRSADLMDFMAGVVDEPYAKIISGDRSPVIEADVIRDAAPETDLRGEGVLRRLEQIFLRVNRLVGYGVPDAMNPFAQMGAVANTTLIVALVTGVLLLFWYVPSVHQGYDSVAAMEASYLAGLLRSLHRYSSDACMLFLLLHAVQTLFARKTGRTRWLGWISGLVMASLVWFDGWTGYWLVWDERARQVALGSAAVLDALPIFSDPIARSFLTDGSVNSLFFFIVFFTHMLIPLVLGIGLWVHVTRLNSARLFTGRRLSAAMVLALTAVSLLYPTASAAPAKMAVAPENITIDGFYLLPLFLTDRLQGGLLWGAALLAAIVLVSIPWWISRRRPEPAVVKEDSCNGCTLCYQDCPYDAIAMVPHTGGRHPYIARVDPMKCVGCGICVGACDSNAIDQTRLPAMDVRRWLNQQVDQDAGGAHVAFICAGSAGADLHIDRRGESEMLPGYRIVPVPCTGWVHMLMVERVLRRGARGVLLVGCGPDPSHRTGNTWTAQRLDGAREPVLRSERVTADKVRHVQYDRSNPKGLVRAAAVFRAGLPEDGRRRGTRLIARYGPAVAIIVGTIAVMLLGSRIPYNTPEAEATELIVSFEYAGQLVDADAGTGQDQSELLPHMRSPISTSRTRAYVRLSVSVDGTEVLNSAYEPSGFFDDGSSIALERIPISEGRHHVAVRLGDSGDPDEWTIEAETHLDFVNGERRVAILDRSAVFAWY